MDLVEEAIIVDVYDLFIFTILLTIDSFDVCLMGKMSS